MNNRMSIVESKGEEITLGEIPTGTFFSGTIHPYTGIWLRTNPNYPITVGLKVGQPVVLTSPHPKVADYQVISVAELPDALKRVVRVEPLPISIKLGDIPPGLFKGEVFGVRGVFLRLPSSADTRIVSLPEMKTWSSSWFDREVVHDYTPLEAEIHVKVSENG